MHANSFIVNHVNVVHRMWWLLSITNLVFCQEFFLKRIHFVLVINTALLFTDIACIDYICRRSKYNRNQISVYIKKLRACSHGKRHAF